MAEQLLRDANIEPTAEVICAALGAANGAYINFLNKVKNHGMQVDWRFYNDGKAWLGKGLYKWQTVRGANKEVTAFWLSVWEGFFKVSVFIPEKARAGVLALPLSGEMKTLLEEAVPLGKLKFFPVVFDIDENGINEDIYTLINFRKEIK